MRFILTALGGLLALPTLILTANWAVLDRVVAAELSEDYRNDSIHLRVYHRYGVIPDEIVIDLRQIEDSASMADVDRVLFTVAEALQARDYSHVYLAYRGSSRYMLDGEYFADVGREYAYQNPVYLVRTLPENVLRLDGRPAFQTWTGGMLGVLNAQLRDHEEFHLHWYLDAEISRAIN